MIPNRNDPVKHEYQTIAKSEALWLCSEVRRSPIRVLTTVAPNWSVVDYSAFYGRLLDACWFAWKLPEGWSRTMIDSCYMRHDTDIALEIAADL